MKTLNPYVAAQVAKLAKSAPDDSTVFYSGVFGATIAAELDTDTAEPVDATLFALRLFIMTSDAGEV